MIEFQNVSKLYGNKEALSNLNLQIENGEIMGLIGHNGAGKSTTIKSLVSIISPSSGRILVDGQELSENRLAIKRKIGYVADSPDLFLRQAAFDLKQMMKEHAQKGKTVLFSTHVLEVAEQVCDRIAILKKGHLIYCGSVEDLRKDHPDQSLESIYLSLAGRKEEVTDASQGH